MQLPVKSKTGEESVLFTRFGYVIVYAERLDPKYDKLNLTLNGETVGSKSASKGPQDYRIEIFKRVDIPNSEADYVIVYRTEVRRYSIRRWHDE